MGIWLNLRAKLRFAPGALLAARMFLPIAKSMLNRHSAGSSAETMFERFVPALA